jgi:MurNAc alpha-1-phosphate uridylyltransferase
MLIENAMVLAAGLGTRLRPITDTMPKPLVCVAGKPMIDHVLDLLGEAGITKAVVNVHHFADQMEQHLSARTAPAILISDERAALMNSGGGLAKGLTLLPPGPVLVMNADLFWINEPEDRSNLRRLAEAFDPERMDMLLLCVDLEQTTGHNGKRDFSLGSDGRLVRFEDGMAEPVVYAGAIAMMTTLLEDAPKDAFNLNIYFDKAAAAGRLFGLKLEGDWITVGTPDAIEEADALFARRSAKA